MVQVDLAAHLADRRHVGALQPLRDVLHGAGIDRHVLALDAVAARRGRDEAAALVAKAERETVDLGLRREGERRIALEVEEAADALDESRDVLVLEGVAERQHRRAVAHLGEFLRRLGADLAGEALVAAEFRELRLERLVALPQGIVFGVGNRRRVLLVITLVVPGDLAAERLVLVLRLAQGEPVERGCRRGRLAGFRHRWVQWHGSVRQLSRCRLT